MIVWRFAPKDDMTQEAVTAKSVEVEVDSNFNNLRASSTRWQSCPASSRSRTSRSTSATSNSDKTIHAMFELKAYYADRKR